jgi:hypothetical protein
MNFRDMTSAPDSPANAEAAISFTAFAIHRAVIGGECR